MKKTTCVMCNSTIYLPPAITLRGIGWWFLDGKIFCDKCINAGG